MTVAIAGHEEARIPGAGCASRPADIVDRVGAVDGEMRAGAIGGGGRRTSEAQADSERAERVRDPPSLRKCRVLRVFSGVLRAGGGVS